MGIGSVLETVDVVLDCFGFDSLGNGSFLQNDGVMNSLSATQDFLSSHEEIVGTGESGIVLTYGGVEGSGFDWVPVEHVEIGVIFESH